MCFLFCLKNCHFWPNIPKILGLMMAKLDPNLMVIGKGFWKWQSVKRGVFGWQRVKRWYFYGTLCILECSLDLQTNNRTKFSPVEFHQHMALAYAENFFVISSYLWPPESKSEWCKCVHVERSEIWVNNAFFGQKTCFLACCKAFTHFSLLILIDNSFQKTCF